jgi:chromosome segregation ATPase
MDGAMRTPLRLRPLLLLAGLFLAFPAWSEDALEAKAREEWMAGYVRLEEGGRAEEAGDTAQALTLYREALQTFEEVRRKHPGWNPSLLGYRITYCTQRIRRIESQVKQQTTDMSQQDLAKMVAGQVDRIRQLSEENQTLRSRLASTADSLERARLEAARTVSAAEDIKDVMAERARLKDENAARNQQVEQLTAEVTELRKRGGLEQVARQLQEDLDRTRVREKQLEEAFDTYRRAYDNVKEKLRQTTAEQERWVRQNRELTERAETAVADAAEAGRALADLQARLAALEQRRGEDGAALARQQTEAETMRRDLEQARNERVALRRFRDEAVQAAEERQLLVDQARALAVAKTAAEERVAALETQYQAVNERNAAMEKQLEERDRRHAEHVAGLVQERDTLRNQAKTAAEERDRVQADLAAARERETALTAQLREAPTAAAQPADEEVRRQLAALQERSLAEQRRHSEAAQAREALLRQLQAERDDALRRAREGTDELAALRREHETLSRDLAPAAGSPEQVLSLRELVAALLRASAETQQQLATARATMQTQEGQLRSQGEKLAEAVTLGRQLEDQGKALTATLAEAEALRQDLVRERTALAELRDQSREAQTAWRQSSARAADLEKQNAELAARLRDHSRNAEDSGRSRQETGDQVEQLRAMLAAAEGERTQLRQKSDEQIALLRQQEKSLRDLEQQRRELSDRVDRLGREMATMKAHGDEQAAAFAREAAMMKAKVEVVDGLSESLSDADGATQEMRRQLAALEQQNATLQARYLDASGQLQARDQEVARYRDAMAQGSSAREGTLLKQLKEASTRLEAETEKRRALEAALAALPVAAGVAATKATAESGTPVDPETDRRAREVAALVRGYLRQAVAAEKDGKVEAARWNYQRVLEHDGQNKLATQRLGLLAAEQGNDDESMRYLKRAFTLDPDDLRTMLPLGFTLLRRQEPDLAVSMLSRAVAIEPGNAVAHRCLGLACSSLGWYDAAEVQFRRAHELNGKDGENAFNLAVLLSTRQPPRLDEARTWYEQALTLGVARDPGLDRLFGMGN